MTEVTEWAEYVRATQAVLEFTEKQSEKDTISSEWHFSSWKNLDDARIQRRRDIFLAPFAADHAVPF